MLQTIHCVPTWLPDKGPPSRTTHGLQTPHAALPHQGSMKGIEHKEWKENDFSVEGYSKRTLENLLGIPMILQ